MSMKPITGNHTPLLAGMMATAIFLVVAAVLDHAQGKAALSAQQVRVAETLEKHRFRIESELNRDFALTTGIQAFIHTHNELNQDISEKAFTAFARTITDKHSAILGLQAAPDGIIRFTYPAAPQSIGLNLFLDPKNRAVALRQVAQRSMMVGGPFRLKQGGVGIVARRPIFMDDGSFWGFATVIVDFPALVAAAGLDNNTSELLIALRGKDGLGEQGDVILGDAGTFAANPTLMAIHFPGGSWQLAGIPRAGWTTAWPQRTLFAVGALIGSFLIGALVWRTLRQSATLKQLNQHAIALNRQIQEEQLLARSVLDRAVMGANAMPAAIRTTLLPAATFNGDIFLSAYTPAGDLNILVGDFTGHGLVATIGALPISEIFRAMSGKGFQPPQILLETNRKLRQVLPTGKFLSCIFVQIPRGLGHVTAINCGMPGAWLVRDGKVEAEFKSRALPLGIMADIDFRQAETTLPILRGDHLLLMSDGVIEAENSRGEMIGAETLRQAVTSGRDASPLDTVIDRINAFCGSVPQRDDITMVDVELGATLFAAADSTGAARPASHAQAPAVTADRWKLDFELSGALLRDIDPVPLLVSFIQELPGLNARSTNLSVVLSELYVNALDHGVLQLDSKLKNGDFSRYLHERGERLKNIEGGRIAVSLACRPHDNGHCIELTVEDSGDGFDHTQSAISSGSHQPHGRGLMLVSNLCRTLEHKGVGNTAQAQYCWSSDAADQREGTGTGQRHRATG